MIGEIQRQAGILLHQQDADALVGVDAPQDAENVLHDQRRETERRLVQQQQPGLTSRARAIASICCSPPDSVPACWR